MRAILLISALFFSFPTWAKITAKVKSIKGQVLYNGKPLGKTSVVDENGVIEVKPKSYVQLFVPKYNSTMSLGAGAKLQLKFKKKKEASPFVLLDGLLRWTTRGKAKKKGIVKTKLASFGVRGTDFLVVVSELLGETEIYCFDGRVVMANRKKRKDRIEVTVNDWGGIGGRFGKGVGEAVPMTDEQITHVKSLLK